MAVKIRLKRVGARNHPVFRIVVADGRSPRDGKFIEEIGTYHPQRTGTNFSLDLDRAKYWVEQGAQPSDTVSSFIKKAGKAAIAGDVVAESAPVEPAVTAAPAPAPAPAPAAAAEEAAPAPAKADSATESGETAAEAKPESN